MFRVFFVICRHKCKGQEEDITPLFALASVSADLDFLFEILFVLENATGLTMLHSQGDVELPSWLVNSLWVSLVLAGVSWYLQTFDAAGLRTCLSKFDLSTGSVKAWCTVIEDIPAVVLSLLVSMWGADGAFTYNGNFGAVAMANIVTAGFSALIKLAEAWEERRNLFVNYKGEEVSLNGKCLGDAVIARVAKRLCQNTTVIKVELNNNFIENTKCLGRMLCENKTLVSLDISFNRITDIAPVTEALNRNRRAALRILKVRGNKIRHIEEGAWMTSLTEVDISQNDLDDDSGKAIANMLDQNKTLEILKLWGNVRIRSSIPAMAKALRDNTTLTVLGIPLFHGGKMLGEMLTQNKTLQRLAILSSEKTDIVFGGNDENLDMQPIVDALRQNQASKLNLLVLPFATLMDWRERLQAAKSGLRVEMPTSERVARL
ncbi:unnamed protein product [Prorocentrum cordatum]|uniref:Uncharacterized protein n=1 Tax=Prorocentrum cordatum TaxID=2364126 RepID=A0ABN9RFL6_9DINO|nr:unnamed protein product [Polarella glacialis]